MKCALNRSHHEECLSPAVCVLQIRQPLFVHSGMILQCRQHIPLCLTCLVLCRILFSIRFVSCTNSYGSLPTRPMHYLSQRHSRQEPRQLREVSFFRNGYAESLLLTLGRPLFFL